MVRVVVACGLLGVGCGDDGNQPVDAGADATIDAAPDAGVTSATCRDGWCWMYPKPQGNALQAVFGFSNTDVWVAGDNGALAHFDGATWTEHAPPGSKNAALYRIYGAAPNDVWAVGASAIYHWNGSAWTDASMPGTWLAIGGGAANDVWIAEASTGGAVHQWNGTSWSSRPTPFGTARTIAFASSGGSTYAVSAQSGIAKLVGGTWGTVDAGNHVANAAAFVSPTQVVTAGDSGSVWFYDGNGWTEHVTPMTTSWTTITAASLSDVWVSDGFTAAHWNGTAWTQATTNVRSSAGRQGLWLDSTGAPWLVAWNSQVRTFSAGAWTQRTTGTSDLVHIAGTADNDIWVTTIAGGTRHWNGTAWTDVVTPTPAGCEIRDVWAAAANDAWIALACSGETGDMAPRRLLHWDGTAWSVLATFGAETTPLGRLGFNAVWGSAANDVYAAAFTALYHYNGTAWSPVAGGPTGGDAVFGVAANDHYVAQGNVLFHWNGTAWSMKTTTNVIVAGLQTDASSVWLGAELARSNSGAFYDGSVFVTAPFVGTPAGTAADVFVQERDTNGLEEVRYQGGRNGTRTATPAFFEQADAWRSPSGKTYVISGGLLVHDP